MSPGTKELTKIDNEPTDFHTLEYIRNTSLKENNVATTRLVLDKNQCLSNNISNTEQITQALDNNFVCPTPFPILKHTSVKCQSLQNINSMSSTNLNKIDGNVKNREDKIPLKRRTKRSKTASNLHSTELRNYTFSKALNRKSKKSNSVNSLRGLVLSAHDLEYNGLEFSDPVAKMHTHFNAYTPLDTQSHR